MKHSNILCLLTRLRQRVMGFPSLLYGLAYTRTRRVWTTCPHQHTNSLVAALSHSNGERNLHRQHPLSPTNPPCNSVTLYCRVLRIKHYKISCIFPSFGQNYSHNSITTWNSEQPQWSSTSWQIDLYEEHHPFLCTVFLSAKPHTEPELKVPYARRNNNTHCLLCTQHEPATLTVSKWK